MVKRLVAVLTTAALLTIYIVIQAAIPPQAFQEGETRASTADLIHPPTAIGSSAIAAPANTKR